MGMHAEPTIKHLIVDSSPLLTAPLSSLRGMAQSYLVTPDVVAELRDKKGREVMREAEMYLGVPGEGGLEGGKGGFTIREPTAEAIAKGELSFVVYRIGRPADEQQSLHSPGKLEISPFFPSPIFESSLSA